MSTVGHIVVMGVSGSGKSTVAAALAEVLGRPFAEGDEFHPASNVAKMSDGVPLTDADREPWLDRIREWMDARAAEGASTVVACSALRRSYRERLAAARGRVAFVQVDVPPDELRRRMREREHFMPVSLLDSQLATLEPVAGDEDGFLVDGSQTPDEIVAGLVALCAES